MKIHKDTTKATKLRCAEIPSEMFANASFLRKTCHSEIRSSSFGTWHSWATTSDLSCDVTGAIGEGSTNRIKRVHMVVLESHT